LHIVDVLWSSFESFKKPIEYIEKIIFKPRK
jgi:hypothetical protein